MGPGLRTIVYVDGFNLYYGAVKDTSYKWLDLGRMCDLLLPPNDIQCIKYFTAHVTARPNDPAQPTRQDTYLRALRTIPNLEIIFGHFLSNKVTLPRADGMGFERVIKTEEKGSDVNIATHFLRDAFQAKFDIGVLVTNDSDLVEPIRIVSQELGLKVGVLSPTSRRGRRPSRELIKHATFTKRIRDGVLKASQFPDPLSDAKGLLHKPSSW